MAKSEAVYDYETLKHYIDEYLSNKKRRLNAVSDLKKHTDKLARLLASHDSAFAGAEKGCRKALKELEPKVKRILELEKEAKDAKRKGQAFCDKELKKLERECQAVQKKGGQAFMDLQNTLPPLVHAATMVQNGCCTLIDTQW